VTPETALNEQIKRYRAMTGEQRLKIALDLHELACDVAREGIRHQHPNASEKEVEDLLRQRIALEREIKPRHKWNSHWCSIHQPGLVRAVA
jgi:hypothetical protein